MLHLDCVDVELHQGIEKFAGSKGNGVKVVRRDNDAELNPAEFRVGRTNAFRGNCCAAMAAPANWIMFLLLRVLDFNPEEATLGDAPVSERFEVRRLFARPSC